MARQPSEYIIKNLSDSMNIKRFWNRTPIENVDKWIRSKGEGLYIVGLDRHVGFIIFKDDKITFLHSSYYYPPLKVVNQNIMDKSPLADSKYRVVGKILDNQMIKKWIINESFVMTFNYFYNQ